MNWILISLAGVASAAGFPASAQDVGQATITASAPCAASEPAPICTDRPTKANVPCTVPAGDVQIESDLINWTRASSAGVQTDTVLYTNPTAKYGIGTHTDFEVSIAPYETVRSREASGIVSQQGSVGDLYLRVKQRLTADDARTQVSIIPYLKLPTARQNVGNGMVEGGAILAASIPLPAGFTLTIGPEIDVLANASGAVQHASLTMLGNVSHAVGKRITLYGEFWTQQNLDPAGYTRQYSFDTAIAYAITPVWQVDLGGNFGLDRATPGSQLYLGLSTRF